MGHEEPKHVHSARERQGADPHTRGRPDGKLTKFTLLPTKTPNLTADNADEEAVSNQPSAKTFHRKGRKGEQALTADQRGSKPGESTKNKNLTADNTDNADLHRSK